MRKPISKNRYRVSKKQSARERRRRLAIDYDASSGIQKGKVDIKSLLEAEAKSVELEGFEIKEFKKIYGKTRIVKKVV